MITFLCLAIGLKYGTQILLDISDTIKVRGFVLAALSSCKMAKETRFQKTSKRQKAENEYNMVFSEYVIQKYGPIADECSACYEWLKKKYPSKSYYYKRTKKMRQWLREKIGEYCSVNGEQGLPLLSDNDVENILENLKNNNDVRLDTIEQGQQGLHLLTNEEIENILVVLKNGSVPPDNNEAAQQDLPPDTCEDNQQDLQLRTADVAAQQDLQLHAVDVSAQQDLQVLEADDVESILRELENYDVPLGIADDEGIHLDMYEETIGDVLDFDLDAELGNDDIFW